MAKYLSHSSEHLILQKWRVNIEHSFNMVYNISFCFCFYLRFSL